MFLPVFGIICIINFGFSTNKLSNMNKIKLNFINHSNDANNSSIVIFQQNVADDFNSLPVAWTVIENCGQGDNHPFTFSANVTVAAGDSYGNYTPQISAYEGQAFEMVKSASGDILQVSSTPASSAMEVEIKNHLQMGAISGNCYRDGKLFATKHGIAPGQKAVFQFKPTIWIGIVSQVEQGEVMNAAIVSEINTEINLLGISSADIVMTGGGPGPSATPFAFTLQNVEMA